MQLTPPKRGIEYPDSDGKPMADNTLQYEWIVTIKGNLDAIFADNPDVFVAGDLLWYPVEGHPEICQAPDTLVAFGRPKGYRGSYKQWEEAGVPPQVVFEILSPNNRPAEMNRKFKFYEQHGVDEYYTFDPDRIKLNGWIRRDGGLHQVSQMNGWTSPRLGIHFQLSSERLVILHPDRSPFMGFQEIVTSLREKDQALSEKERALLRKDRDLELAAWEKAKAETEKKQAQAEKMRAVAEKEAADRLIDELKTRLARYETQ